MLKTMWLCAFVSRHLCSALLRSTVLRTRVFACDGKGGTLTVLQCSILRTGAPARDLRTSLQHE
eukprot:127723-Amphidinium_carterae.1